MPYFSFVKNKRRLTFFFGELNAVVVHARALKGGRGRARADVLGDQMPLAGRTGQDVEPMRGGP
jgi:hypothetical protein